MQITIKQLSDNTPGLAKRYVLQEVKSSPELPICVTVDGECNHADTDIEMVSFSSTPDESEPAQSCNGCGSFYNKYSEIWEK